MSEDAKKATTAIFRGALVAAAAAAAEHYTAGDKLAGIGAGSLAEGFFGLCESLMSGDHGAPEALLVSVHEELLKVHARMGKLEKDLAELKMKPERTDPISIAQTFSQFAKDVTEARSIVKREALVNAAAGMHDPRIGEATRAFWYDVLRDLPDLQIFATRLVAQHGSVGFIRDDLVAIGGEPYEVPLMGEDPHTVRMLLHEMTMAPSRGSVRILTSDPAHGMLEWKGNAYTPPQLMRLSPGGQILAKLIAD